jgi:nicotinamidase-related amidase
MREFPTLVLVDVQRAFDDPAYRDPSTRNNPDAEKNVARLLEAWRSHGAPVIHVHHFETDPDFPMFHKGSTGFEFKPEALPLEGEPVLEKCVNSAFIGTDLEERLRDSGATTVVIAGITTDHCCSTTARMSGNLGFDTLFVGDACATFPRVGPDGQTYNADLMHGTAIASLNGEFAEVVTTEEAVDRLG